MGSATGLVVVTPPAVEPVTLDEAKDYAGIRGSSFDTRIAMFITAARVRLEQDNGRSYIHTTRRYTLDWWPVEQAVIKPPYAPLASVTSITYVDAAGDTQTWAADQYQVDLTTEPGRIARAYGVSWPVIRGDLGGIQIVYVSGHGAAASDVPQEYRLAILDIVRQMWDMPGAYPEGVPAGMPQTEAGKI